MREAILKSPSFTIFPHLQLRIKTDDWEIAPCLTNGRMASLHGLANGKLPATEEKDGNRSLPAAPITENALRTEGLQATPWEGDGKTLALRGHMMMGSRVR